MALTYKNIEPLLLTGKNVSKWMGYLGLTIGVLLLLLSMQLFINIRLLLTENSPRKNGYDFISLSKTITNENMGSDNTFNDSDVAAIQKQTGVDGTAPLVANQFKVRASAGDMIPFSTDLFLESIDNAFIDTLPPSFTWQPGQATIPIIFSSDFLEMYNVFALAEGLPQLSEKTVSSVNITLECFGPAGVENFKGNIVALSDRINSVLVPASFMTWGNQHFSGVTKVKPSRIIIKTKDANNPTLLTYLEKNGYHLNKDKTKFGREKRVLQSVVGGLAVFGILVIIMALMLFSFYLQLMIARSKDNLQLLLTLGYSPRWLGNSVAKTWLPVYITIILAALSITGGLNILFVQLPFFGTASLPWYLHWTVLAMAVVLLGVTLFINARLVKKELMKII
jgi:hypothetical protein